MWYCPSRLPGIVLTLAAVLSCLGPVPAFAQEAPKVPPGVLFSPDLTYRTVETVPLKLDLARPIQAKGPSPAVVILNGGSWMDVGGDRKFCNSLLLQLAQRGFVAIAITHRSAARDPFPAQLHDAKAAVRWLRSNERGFQIDTNRIGAVGFSSGGHLACLLGATSPADGLEGPHANLALSSRVQAVVACYAPTDLVRLREDAQQGKLNFLLAQPTLGVLNKFVPDEKDTALASPITYIRKQMPPLLLIHGSEDPFVPHSQSKVYAQKLREAGANVRLLTLDQTGHGFGSGWGGQAGKQSDEATVQFLVEHFK